MAKKTIAVVSCWILVSVYCAGASAIRVSSFDSAPTTLQDQSSQTFASVRRALLSGTDAKVIDTVWSALHRSDDSLRSRSARKPRAARIRAPPPRVSFPASRRSRAPRPESSRHPSTSSPTSIGLIHTRRPTTRNPPFARASCETVSRERRPSPRSSAWNRNRY